MLTEEQRELRRSGLGGSDIGAIVLRSLNDRSLSYSTAMEVYLSKVDPGYGKDSNKSMHFGNIIEPFLITMFEQETGLSVVRDNETRFSETHPFLLANVDGFIPEENAILEIKNVDPGRAFLWGDEDSDEIPESYLLQVAHYVSIYNANKAYIAAYFGGARFKIFTYERNKSLEEVIIKSATHFWKEHVLKKIPPTPETLEDYQKLYRIEKTQDGVEADDIAVSMIAALKENQEKIKVLEKENDTFKAYLCSQMLDHGKLVAGDGSILATWKTQTSNRIDAKRIREVYPDISDEMTKVTTSRVLRIR